MDYQNQQGLYQTGDTQLPKSYSGIIAILLIVIVILGSVATVLGLLNIRLFQQLSLQSKDADPVNFAQLANTEVRAFDASTNALGISVKTLSVFDQKFYHLPQGVYITDVAPGSSAAVQGVLTGDILISVENTPIPDSDTLEQYLSSCTAGKALNAMIFRSGRLYTVTLTTGGAK